MCKSTHVHTQYPYRCLKALGFTLSKNVIWAYNVSGASVLSGNKAGKIPALYSSEELMHEEVC